MNVPSCPRCKPLRNGANFGGSTDNAYTGIVDGNSKIDQAKIEVDYESINFRFNPVF